MSARASIVNRIVLAVLGLLLLAAGGLGLARGIGTFGARRAESPVLPEAVRTFPDGRPWFWWAVVGVLLLIAVLALGWLLAQLKMTRSTARLDQTTDAQDGYTTLHAGALTKAVEDDAIGIPGVAKASANVHDLQRQELSLRVDLADSADIDTVRARLENEVVAHLREAVSQPDFPVSIELRPGTSRTPERSIA